MDTQPAVTHQQPTRPCSTRLSLFRFVLYLLTLFGTLLVFILSAVVIATQNRDFNSYNDAAAELLAASLLTFLVMIPLHGIFHRTRTTHLASSTLVELAALFALWLLFLGGAAALSHDFQYVRCLGSGLCSQTRALQAFAWMTWGWLTSLVVLVLVVAVQAKVAGRGAVWRDDFGSNAGERGTAAGPAGEKPAQPVA